MRIGVVYVVPRSEERLTACKPHWERYASKGTEIVARVVVDANQPPPLSGPTVKAVAPYVPEVVEELSRDVDVVLIGCVLEPGLEEARKVSRVPVIGAGEATFLTAARSAGRFAMITPVDADYMRECIERLGVTSSVTSVRQLPLEPFMRFIAGDRDDAVNFMLRDMTDSIVSEGARAVCVGCCGFPYLEDEMQQYLPVPMIMPHPATLAVAELIGRAQVNRFALAT